MSNILTLNGVNAYYGSSHILFGVDLAVEKGRSACILGRNGVGKSTTMKTICGAMNPKNHARTEGSIRFGDKELVGMSPYQIAQAGIAYVPLDELYSRADIISLHCPLTDQTRYMIGDVAISHMKPGVILINTGRGQLIHTEALIDGLKEKKIGAAGLDVYEEEAGYFYEDTSDRIMDDDVLARLLSFNNVIVTSHQGFFTREAVDNIAHTTMQNIRDFDEHRHLENEVRAEPENAVGQL